MKHFISVISKETTKEIDPSLFDRTKEPSIAEFIVSGLKVIESLPYIKFVSWKHITDASKIDIKLNRRHLKNRDIIKDKEIEKLVSIRDTAQEMLQMNFVINYDGETIYIKKNLLIPAYVDSYHFLINGKEVLPQKQIVDMSTYNQKESVKLKTTLTPIDIYKTNVKNGITTTDGINFKVKTFILNLFTKELNPLYYYTAKFGLHKTIKYFGMENIVDFVDEEFDKDLNYYFQVKDYYVEVDKYYFKNMEFVRSFTYMIYDIFNNMKIKFSDIDNVNYWVSKLGSLYTTNTKNYFNKGNNVLVSFKRILDDITKKTLRLDKKNLQSTHSLIRWVIQNYSDLRKKDNHDLTMKRIRCNEVTAFYFIQSMSHRINHLLNTKKLTIESIKRIFNWNPDELFKLMLSNKSTLLKYDPDINCFGLLNALRFSFLGSQGISGGKNIGDQFRDIYPSHIGRIDLNGISHGKNTALTGFIVPSCEIFGNGYFSKKSKDPDNFNNNFSKIREGYDSKKIERHKELSELKNEKYKYIMKTSLEGLTKINGCILIHRKVKPLINEDTNHYIIQPRNYDKNYIRRHKNSNGAWVTEDNRYIIGKRKLKLNENNLFVIGKRKEINSININGIKVDNLKIIHRKNNE